MIESTLLNLVEAIKNQTFKSKQACFDYYLNDLLAVKQFYSWVNITNYINNATGDSLSLETYRFMLKRSKNRRKKTSNSIIKSPENKTTLNSSNDKKIIRTPYELKQLIKKSVNLEELLKFKGDDE